MDGFETQLRPMTESNFDFFIHAVIMLYTEYLQEKTQAEEEEQETVEDDES